MEATAANPKAKKGPSTFVIVLLFLLLIGGGVGVYFALKPKTKDDKGKEGTDTGEQGGASGRKVSTHSPRIPPHVLAKLLADQQNIVNQGEPGSSPQNPLYYKSSQALNLIAMKAKEIQENPAAVDPLRAQYNIGEAMDGRNKDEQECIEEMFGKLLNIDFTSDPDRKYLSYPVYGTYEPNGKEYRAELQNLIDRGWEGLNLTHLRDHTQPWWLKKIGLNLLVGTTVYQTPTTHNTWASWAPRSELDFFKKFNGHWNDDKDLADVYVNRHNTQQVVGKDHPDARAAFCATGMYEFAKRWIAEIDRLDEMTEVLAFKILSDPTADPRIYFTYVNPDTGVDEENTSSNPYAQYLGNSSDKNRPG